MPVTNIQNTDEFEKFICSSKVSVINFSVDWAEQCQQATDVLKQLSTLPDIQSSGTQFGICEAENLSQISLKYKIHSVPTVLFFKEGLEIDRIDGADAAVITTKVRGHSIGSESGDITKNTLEEKLKSLINRSNVMVFMKGNREVPKCGFSRTLIQILNDTGVQYDTFDILTDEQVRQGLKEYSDWPTYPQLYVKGELIGGLDIIKELKANGELQSTLNA